MKMQYPLSINIIIGMNEVIHESIYMHTHTYMKIGFMESNMNFYVTHTYAYILIQ